MPDGAFDQFPDIVAVEGYLRRHFGLRRVAGQADLRALPDAVTAQMSELKGYRYNNVDGKVLLVDPKTYAVVAVLGE